MDLREVQPGEAILAGDWNRLIAFLREVDEKIRRVEGGGSGGQAKVLRGRIVAVILAAVDVGREDGLANPSTTFYRVQPRGLGPESQFETRPHWGNAVDDQNPGTARIVPAKVGDKVLIIRDVDEDGQLETFVLIRETIRGKQGPC